MKISAYSGENDFLEPPTAAKKSFDFMVNNQESIKFTKLKDFGHSTFFFGRNIASAVDLVVDDCNNF